MTNLPPQLAKLCRAVRSSYTGQSTSSSDIRCMPRWCCRGIHKVRALQVKRLIPLVASASPVTMTRKLRILALHSFRTSGKTFALQVLRRLPCPQHCRYFEDAYHYTSSLLHYSHCPLLPFCR